MFIFISSVSLSLSMLQVSSDIALRRLFNPLTTPPETQETGFSSAHRLLHVLLQAVKQSFRE